MVYYTFFVRSKMTNIEEDIEKELYLKQVAIDEALNLIRGYGTTDGDHHKQWVLDQVVRILKGNDYEEWVKDHNGDAIDSDGNTEYEWDVGIPP